jgi:hypothetical protein
LQHADALAGQSESVSHRIEPVHALAAVHVLPPDASKQQLVPLLQSSGPSHITSLPLHCSPAVMHAGGPPVPVQQPFCGEHSVFEHTTPTAASNTGAASGKGVELDEL